MEDFYCDFVLTGKVPIEKIIDDDKVLAFYHTKPSYRVHIVIIPKEHIMQLSDVKDYLIIQEIFEAIQAVTDILRLQTYRVITNSGEYQDSKHLHFHLISE